MFISFADCKIKLLCLLKFLPEFFEIENELLFNPYLRHIEEVALRILATMAFCLETPHYEFAILLP